MLIAKIYIFGVFLLGMLFVGVAPIKASVLHNAAKSGDVKEIQNLILAGYGLNEADKAGNLALHYAAANGHSEVIFLLAKHDVDLDSMDMRGRTALQISAIAGKLETMEALLVSGASVDAKAKTGETALHVATLLKNADIIALLIKYGADLNILTRHETIRALNGSPLHWAIQRGDGKMVDQLITAGADMDLKNSRGLTPSDQAYSAYLSTRNSIYFEMSRLLKIRADQRKMEQGAVSK